MLNSQLLTKIKTTEERDILVSEIELLLKSLYGGSANSFQSALENSVRSWTSQIIASETDGLGKKEGYLTKLKNNLLEMKNIQLGLAYEPSNASLERIHDRLIKLVGNNILIDLTINKAIVGGAVIIYNGQYRDFSMKRIFDAEMKAAGEDVLKILEKNTALKV